MKKIYSCMLGIGIAAMMLSCKNESPFSATLVGGEGRVLTTSLNLEVKVEEQISRATQVPSVDDFTVAFCKSENPEEAYLSYGYRSLPEIVTLPAGDYVIKAYYGDDNIVAAFDSPAYYGESGAVTIESGKVYDLQQSIICRLHNVRVSVGFDPELTAVMSDDSKVTVKVGENGSLEFTKNTTSDGFFQYVEDSTTLAATFTGTVNGANITEIKNYDNVKRGTYYKLTFKLRKIDPGQEGSGPTTGNASIIIDATVTYHDYSSEEDGNLEPEEEYLEDDRYPGQSGNHEDDNPTVPDNPEDPDTDGLPQLVSDDVDLNVVTDISTWPENKNLAVKILTPTKLNKFVCEIKSTFLTAEELEQVNLKPELDLINDTDLFGDLSALGFPVGEEITDPDTYEDGNYVIVFDITKFVSMLNISPGHTHDFVFHLKNEGGEVERTLKLKN